MRKFIELLLKSSQSRKKRCFCIGNDSIRAFMHFTNGYRACLRIHGIPDDGEYEKFDRFVRESLKAELESPLSIWTLFAQRTKTDEEAFDLFYKLLKEYCQSADIHIE